MIEIGVPGLQKLLVTGPYPFEERQQISVGEVRQIGGGEKGVHAAVLPAVAALPAGHEGNVADLAALLMVAAVDAAVYYHGAADVVAEHQIKSVFHFAVHPDFREGRGIGVVKELDVIGDIPCEIPQGRAAQVDDFAEKHALPVRVHQSRETDAHAENLLLRKADVLDKGGQSASYILVIFVLGPEFHAVPGEGNDGTGQIHGHHGHVVEGYVDAQGYLRILDDGIGNGPPAARVPLGTGYGDQPLCHQLIYILGDGGETELQIRDQILLRQFLMVQEMVVDVGAVDLLDFNVHIFFLVAIIEVAHLSFFKMDLII